jgi:hypothetical protein
MKASDFKPGDLVEADRMIARVVAVDDSDDTVQVSFLDVDVDPEAWVPWLPSYGQWYPVSQVRKWGD